MAKVIQPIEELWEGDKKSDFLVLSKKENDTGIVKAKTSLKKKSRKKKK